MKQNEVSMISQCCSRLIQEYAVDILSRQNERRLNSVITNQNSILKGTSESLAAETICTEGNHKVILHGKTKHFYNISNFK
jgi:hypothetical protein